MLATLSALFGGTVIASKPEIAPSAKEVHVFHVKVSRARWGDLETAYECHRRGYKYISYKYDFSTDIQRIECFNHPSAKNGAGWEAYSTWQENLYRKWREEGLASTVT